MENKQIKQSATNTLYGEKSRDVKSVIILICSGNGNLKEYQFLLDEGKSMRIRTGFKRVMRPKII